MSFFDNFDQYLFDEPSNNEDLGFSNLWEFLRSDDDPQLGTGILNEGIDDFNLDYDGPLRYDDHQQQQQSGNGMTMPSGPIDAPLHQLMQGNGQQFHQNSYPSPHLTQLLPMQSNFLQATPGKILIKIIINI